VFSFALLAISGILIALVIGALILAPHVADWRSTKHAPHDSSHPPLLRVTLLILLSVVGIAGMGLFVSFVFRLLRNANAFTPEIALTILLVSGMIALITALAFVVAVVGSFRLADRNQALGLPQGSISAVIALSLILIFSITAIHLYARLSEVRSATVQGLNQRQVRAIPGDQIQSIRSTGRGRNRRFTVMRILPQSEQSQDFALQVLTTVSTLVVAVSGFYFGQRAARRREDPSETPTVRISPASGQKLSPGGSLNIRVRPRPANQAMTWTVTGDSDDSLVAVTATKFRYTMGVAAQEKVTLTFALAGHPDVAQEFTIERS
jgi:hypothetical protein